MESLNQNVEIESITCPFKNKGKFVCKNPFCTDQSLNPFICTNQQCQSCKTAHIKCKLFRVSTILQQISEKKKKITPQINKSMRTMERIYDECIDRIMQDKEHAIAQMQFFGLNVYQAQFMKLISEGRIDQLTGKKITSNVHKNIKTKEQFLTTEEIVLKQWKKGQTLFNTILNKMKKIQNKKVVFFDSVLTDDFQTIQSFFDTEILQMKLLYRASQQNFSTYDFHNKCDGKSNTITIIETQFGKIIGGYTPCEWQQSNNYAQDYKCQSFLFSITHQQKYKIVNPNEAIYGGTNYGPTFGGGHDIYITSGRNNRRNRNYQYQEDQQYGDQGSYFNFPYSYNSEKGNLVNSSMEAIARFTGRQDGNTYCDVKEYQVFQLQFL